MGEVQTIRFSQSELRDGDLKTFTVGDTRVLVGRIGDGFYDTQGSCPHYGAELAKGALCEGRVICPWHHASFDLRGALLEPPALDGLKTCPVGLDGDSVTVILEARPPETPEPTPNGGGQTTLILGGGAAGLTAALAAGARHPGAGGPALQPGAGALRPAQREQGVPRWRGQARVAAPAQ